MSGASHRWTLLVACGICALAVLFIPVTVPTEDGGGTPRPGSIPGTSEADASPVGPIQSGRIAIQQFPAAGTRIRSIALLLATYRRTNHGTAVAIVQAYVDNQWRNLASQTFAKEKLEDNAYYTLAFSPQLTVARGEPIRIILSSNGVSSDAITWWTNIGWHPDGYTLMYGDRPQPGTASFQIDYAASTGPLIALIGPLWHRLTVFLSPLWQGALLASFSLMIVGALTLGYVYSRRSAPDDR